MRLPLEGVQRTSDDGNAIDCRPARVFYRRNNECFEFAG